MVKPGVKTAAVTLTVAAVLELMRRNGLTDWGSEETYRASAILRDLMMLLVAEAVEEAFCQWLDWCGEFFTKKPPPGGSGDGAAGGAVVP